MIYCRCKNVFLIKIAQSRTGCRRGTDGGMQKNGTEPQKAVILVVQMAHTGTEVSMRKSKKALGMMLAVCMTASAFAGCGGGDESDGPGGSKGSQGKELYKSLDPNTAGTLDIMVWSGDSIYYEDIGKQNWEASDITTQNVAAVYAMAKEFNKMYPNVKINLWAKTDDPNGNDTTWAQEMQNFRAEHGKLQGQHGRHQC